MSPISIVDSTAARPQPPYIPTWVMVPKPRLANTWERYSPKAKRAVRVIGDLRYFMFLILESMPGVVELCEEPFRFRVDVDGHSTTTQFDMWFRESDGQDYYWDAYYVDQLVDAEKDPSRWRELHAKVLCALTHELRYAICTEKSIIRYPKELANWTSILGYLHRGQDAIAQELGRRISRCVQAKGRTTLREIEAAFPDVPAEEVQSATYAELHAGRLSADLANTLLTANTIFHT